MDIYCIPIKHANCYLVKIDDFYLAIDAGWPGCFHEYLKALKTYNIKPERIKYLIVTHFHPDHAGMAENIKSLGTGFILFEHQIPYIQMMEKMIKKMSKKDDGSYLPLDMNSNLVLGIDESESFFKENNIPAQAIKTIGHSDDSISVVFKEGYAFIGDLYSPDLVAEDDCKSRQSWYDLKLKGAKTIYPAHGTIYSLERIKR